jgi:hypothetical protein
VVAAKVVSVLVAEDVFDFSRGVVDEYVAGE